MKVIDLSDRIIPVDKIDFLSKNTYSNDRGKLFFKNGECISVIERDFKIIKDYLLSLNDEDNKPLSEVQRLFNKLDVQDQEYILNILRIFNNIPTKKDVEK